MNIDYGQEWTMDGFGRSHPPERLRRLLISDMVVSCMIGVYAHEHGAPQQVRFNVELLVSDPPAPRTDRLEDVLNYETVVKGIRDVTASGHINLVETLAERIADLGLAQPGVRAIKVRVEKLDVFEEVGAVGVEILRSADPW